MYPTPIRIMLADDHTIFRQGLAQLLVPQNDMLVVAHAENGEQMVTMARALQPDIILADIKMPLMTGIDATRIIKKEYPHINILALTMMAELSMVHEMLEAGAIGYLLKEAGSEDVCNGIYAALDNRTFFCTETTLMKTGHSKRPVPIDPNNLLSRREMEVLMLIVDGLSSEEMALALHVSVHTIRGHRDSIRKKTNKKNPVSLIMYAIRRGWVNSRFDRDEHPKE